MSRQTCFATTLKGFILFVGLMVGAGCTLQNSYGGERMSDDRQEYKKADGYRGIWYSCNSLKGEIPYKYSGGLATYCAKHIPLAYYSQKADKTFFVYGGTKELSEENRLLAMVSYYDHKTHTVPKPTILREKGTSDGHHNPTIMLDDDGYVWVFISSHGGKDGFIYKSREPHSVDSFQQMEQAEFTYPQPWFLEGTGFLFLHTIYRNGRQLFCKTSPDGINWTEGKKLAAFGGHYQISWRHKNKVGTAFNYHPKGVDTRTNLYYMESRDFGETWHNVSGEKIETPLDSPDNIALVHNYESEGLLVYLNDINFDTEGNPVIQYVTSPGWHPGPENMPRVWRTARWTGTEWEILRVTESDNNYDTGSLHIEENGLWRIIGPTETGPQAFYPGGEMAVWISKDKGHSWTKERQITERSRFNHAYARRPVNAHPDFYAYWADGNGKQPSEVSLHFADMDGKKVFVLPRNMEAELESPIEK